MIHPLTLSWGSNAADQLQTALDYWQRKFSSIFEILTTSPETFQGGTIWNMIVDIIRLLQGTGTYLLIIFFLYGMFKTTLNYKELANPQHTAMLFIRFIFAKFIVTYGIDMLLGILSWTQKLITAIYERVPMLELSVPEELKTALVNAEWWSGMSAFLASLIGSVMIFLLAIVILVVVYGRFFKIFLLAAISPIPLAGFASEATESLARNFTKAYVGECLRGVIILIACMIFSAFAISPTDFNASTPGGMTWIYVMEVSMQMLLLVITVKSSDRLIKEVFGF